MMEQLMKLKEHFEVMVGFVVGVFTYFIGGIDASIEVLCIFIFIDIISGCFKGWYTNNFSSREFRTGLVGKAIFFLVIVCAYQMDRLLGDGTPVIRTAVVWFYIGVEGTSLIENLYVCGVPIPNVIVKHLKVFKDKGEAEE